MTDLDNYERRIKAAKKRREKLVNLRAEKLAALKSAQEKLRKLEEKASEKGFKLEDLDQIIKQKKNTLEVEIADFENALEEAETQLNSYEE